MSLLRGIDISSWQTGINLSAVPADFVIVKVTEGTNYINPDWKRQAKQTVDTHKRLGLYHYSDGGDVVAEATFFLNQIKEYIGKALLFLDWEGENNPSFGVNDFNWCNHWCDHVRKTTGCAPILYISQSVMSRFTSRNFSFEYWIAQYANTAPTGYQDTPWNEGVYPCLIRQYSSAGQLPGYSGFLDLNKFYGSAADWDARIGKKTSAPSNDKKDQAVPKPSETTLELVANTMDDKYGKGDDRKKALGSRYNEVQNMINHIATAPVDTLVAEVKQGKYGNDPIRKKVLGSRYQEVQDRINQQANSGGVYYEVKAGETLSGIAARYNTTWQRIAKLNGIANPNYIMAGQKIRIK